MERHLAVDKGSDGSSGIRGVGATPAAAFAQAAPSAVLRSGPGRSLEVLPPATLIERWEGSRDYRAKRRELPTYADAAENTCVPVFLKDGALDFFGDDDMTFVGFTLVAGPGRRRSPRRPPSRRPFA